MAKETTTPRTRRRRRRVPAQAARRRRALLAGAVAAVNVAIVAGLVLGYLFVIRDGGGDEDAINSLGRSSIESLPPADYASFYDSFTSDYQLRCPREEFIQAGEAAATGLGDNRPFLRFNRLEDVLIQGDNARAVIVGQVATDPEYKVQAIFRKEDGTWKIAPAADTEGCEAFQNLAE